MNFIKLRASHSSSFNPRPRMEGDSDGSDIKLYVDAKLEILSSFKTKAIKTESFNDVTIGTFGDSGNNFQGTIDEVALFDKALSQKQIHQLSTMSGASFFQPCGDINLNDNFRVEGVV